MKIRTATMNDLASIAEIESICFLPAEAASNQSFADRLTYYPDHFWLLELNSQIIGFINGLATNEAHLTDAMYADASMHDANGAWQMIFGVNTLPEYRNRGYAAILIKKLIAAAKQQQRKGVVLTCKEHMVHYYAKFGFADEGVSDSTHGGVVWHEMRLTF